MKIYRAGGGGGGVDEAADYTWTGSHVFARGTITASDPFSLTQTWNDAGVTFKAFTVAVTDTASAAGSLLMDLLVGASSKFSVTKAGLVTAASLALGGAAIGSHALAATGTAHISGVITSGSGFTRTGATANDKATLNLTGLSFSSNAVGQTFTIISDTTGSGGPAEIRLGSTTTIAWRSTVRTDAGANDLILLRDAANTLAQRNGTNAQAFRIYGTYTDASNYERATLSYVSGSGLYRLESEAAGTGVVRDMTLAAGSAGGQITAQSSGIILFGKRGTGDFWSITAAGHLTAVTDNTYDIGASGATRPRTAYIGTSVLSPLYNLSAGTTVAGLPSASVGHIARVTDADTPAIGSTVVGGGAAAALVWYNGSNWTVVGV